MRTHAESIDSYPVSCDTSTRHFKFRDSLGMKMIVVFSPAGTKLIHVLHCAHLFRTRLTIPHSSTANTH